MGVRPGRKSFWNSIVNKIEKRLAPWKKRFLSKGGRLVLINSVLASIPNYFLSIFKIPMGVAQKIGRIQRSFLWGDGKFKRKVHVVNWVEVCKSKDKGGLGIGRVVDKNKAMLAKWIWHFGREKEALWRRVIVVKYRIQESSLLWKWNFTTKDSFFVKAVNCMLKTESPSAKLVDEGFRVVVGKGDRANFWNEIKWDSKSLKDAFPRIYALAVKKCGTIREFGRLFKDVACIPSVIWTAQCVRLSLKPSITYFFIALGLQPCGEDAWTGGGVVWWYKHFGTNVSDSISVLMLNVKEFCVETKRVKKSLIKDCIPPLMGTFKFNVDGSARGSPGMASIGGVLRDSKGKVVCLFSLGVGITDSNSVEILAIKKAVELCQSSPLLRGRAISIVIDSKVAVSWINSEDFGSFSLSHVNSIYFTRSIMQEWDGIEVMFDSRCYNSFADNLAKLGSSSNGDIIHWN
ncbi:hypothetical protein Dsin_006619 [Dipteronia sinensis]|uniref:RNase H type-1 domain-containing protein n=1 Tax=Dipteronia sinensis TaxID=43782 RepID=A0AAE0AZ24_9ROSI|nr:hypothetical protein Dsin_006619 [Dipteronia sinensis]